MYIKFINLFNTMFIMIIMSKDLKYATQTILYFFLNEDPIYY